jgi:DNA modification methylase
VTKTITRRFGSGKREGHDSTAYYALKIHKRSRILKPTQPSYAGDYDWANQIYLGDSQRMTQVPDDSIGLAFTSPPYSVGKDYDEDRTLDQQLDFIKQVSKEVYRTLIYGGRYIVNVAGIGRRPYIPIQAHVQILMDDIGFKNLGEIVWRKATACRGNCAWGSWMKASSPSLRDVHEYLLVFCKGDFRRHDKGTSTISAEEFMLATTSCWDIQPESAKRIGHPAPFPVALAARAINLYSYQEDVVLDPFNGSGTTCVAAARAGRKYVGYDIVPEYVELARARLAKED